MNHPFIFNSQYFFSLWFFLLRGAKIWVVSSLLHSFSWMCPDKSLDFSFLINYNENLNRTQCNREKPLLDNISINGIKILRISKHKANGAFNIMADVGLNQKHCGYGALQTFQNFLFLSNILSVSWRREGRLIRILFQVSDI